MKHALISALVLIVAAGAARADCYADYKAKQDDPLRLHYGVVQVLGDCTVANAADQLTPDLAADGWQLLEIVSLFEEDGLEERRDSAGSYYLRY